MTTQPKIEITAQTMFLRLYIRLKKKFEKKNTKPIESILSLVELKYFKQWSEILKDPSYQLLSKEGKIALCGNNHHMILDSFDPTPKLSVFDHRESKNICIEIPFNRKGSVELMNSWQEEMSHRFRLMVVQEKTMQISAE